MPAKKPAPKSVPKKPVAKPGARPVSKPPAPSKPKPPAKKAAKLKAESLPDRVSIRDAAEAMGVHVSNVYRNHIATGRLKAERTTGHQFIRREVLLDYIGQRQAA